MNETQPKDAPSAVLTASGLVKAFGLRVVLRGIDFQIAHGETVSLLGPNGSGKTTLLRMLATVSRPTGGKITIGGWSIPKESMQVRSQLGILGHLPMLYDELTAEENLRFFARIYDLPAPSARIQETLARVGLAKRARDLARTFSRGMQQRLAIARAILHDPAILLLDEPYTGLDVKGAAILDSVIEEWHAAGRTVIMSMHDLDHAARLSHRALILSQGKIAAEVGADQLGELPAIYARVTT
jgi:heme exporter protein A